MSHHHGPAEDEKASLCQAMLTMAMSYLLYSGINFVSHRDADRAAIKSSVTTALDRARPDRPALDLCDCDRDHVHPL